MSSVRIGMKLAATLTAFLGLLAIAASVFVAYERYRDLTSQEAFRENAGVAELPFLFGVGLLILSVGLVKAQNWARILVVLHALIFAGGLALLAALAFFFAEGVLTKLGVPALALPGGLVCLWLIHYVSIGPGRSHFPGFTSRASMLGFAKAAGCLAVGVGAFFTMGVATVVWDFVTYTPAPPVPAASEVEARLERVLAQIPDAERVGPIPCPDAEIVRISRAKRWCYFGTLVFVSPVLYEAQAPHWQPAEGWEWATDARIRRLGEGRKWDLASVAVFRYLAVLRPTERSLPEVLYLGEAGWSKRRMRAGRDFRPGVFRGGLFIMDVERATVVCQTPIDVRNAPTVEYWDYAVTTEEARVALMRDFEKQLGLAVRGISRAVRVDF